MTGRIRLAVNRHSDVGAWFGFVPAWGACRIELFDGTAGAQVRAGALRLGKAPTGAFFISVRNNRLPGIGSPAGLISHMIHARESIVIVGTLIDDALPIAPASDGWLPVWVPNA